ncbi:LysR family transcriptional regulator [Demequina sp. NBRC 110052]|uniref:LysR family transcriptional regulator n=1 Tax=Demequina sp. NBRC 110052 TaxID=1570341 RepID=UPI000A0783EC|nr:LysR family transcriptional regulator [Demequina sp. NBRC 110052]
MLDVTRLAMLREFAMRGTIAAAAEAMGYTPSAVSQQISALEREAGVRLTRRSGRRLTLTPPGQRLVEHAGRVLAALDAAEADLHDADAPLTGTVRVAVFQSAALAIVPPALRALARQHPALRVHVLQSEPGAALADVWARDVDLVVAEEYPHHSAPHYAGMSRRALVRDEIRLCVAGQWADATSLSDVAAAPWVMEPAGTATRHFAEQACRNAGFEPDVRVESADLQAHVRLIESGLVVGLLPGLMWGVEGLQLIAHPLAVQAWRTVFSAARDSAGADPAIAAVRDALESAASDLGPEVGAEPLTGSR